MEKGKNCEEKEARKEWLLTKDNNRKSDGKNTSFAVSEDLGQPLSGVKAKERQRCK